MIFKIPFRAYAGKPALEVEIGDDIEPQFQMRAALGVVIEKAKETDARADLADAYRASRPGQHAPHFYAQQDRAMEDIKKCAAEQLAASQVAP